MCINLLLSFYHIDYNSDVINGSIRYFFWAIGVMRKLLRAQWTEKVWAPLVSSVAMVTTQWKLAFFVGAVYWKINLCFVLSVLFFLLSHLLFQQCVSVPGVLLLQRSRMAEQMLWCRAVLWVALKVHAYYASFRERRERCVLCGNNTWGGLLQSENRDDNLWVPWVVMAYIALLWDSR